MKKILGYVGFFVLILGSLMIVLIFNKKDNIYNSVVYIESTDEITIRNGSGFVYKVDDHMAYIITSYHVIEGYVDVYIYNNNKEKTKANIVSFDEYTDIAILSIEDSLRLKKISIGDSNKVSIDDEVVIVGTPIDISNINTITEGVISSINNQITITTTYGTSNLNTIEVDANVDVGNSGGPLLNKNNEVIGMMFAKEINEVSYALPINFIMDIVKKLENNEIDRPNLGAVLCNTTNIQMLNKYGIEIIDIAGVVVLEIKDSYPLYNAGLKKGDIITSFNNKKISNVTELREELYNIKKGEQVVINYCRQKKCYEININL